MNSPHFRIGHGYDLHRLQSGGKLMLGGIEVCRDLRPVAHSDGDVVKYVLKNRGAVGYVSAGVSLQGAKILTLR